MRRSPKMLSALYRLMLLRVYIQFILFTIFKHIHQIQFIDLETDSFRSWMQGFLISCSAPAPVKTDQTTLNGHSSRETIDTHKSW